MGVFNKAIPRYIADPVTNQIEVTPEVYVDDIFDPILNARVKNAMREKYGNAFYGTLGGYEELLKNTFTGNKGILGPGMGLLSTFGRSMDKADDILLGTLTEAVKGVTLQGAQNPLKNIFVNDEDYTGRKLLAATANSMRWLAGGTTIDESELSPVWNVPGTMLDFATDPGFMGSRLARQYAPELTTSTSKDILRQLSQNQANSKLGAIGQLMSNYDDFMSKVSIDVAAPGLRPAFRALKGKMSQFLQTHSATPYADYIAKVRVVLDPKQPPEVRRAVQQELRNDPDLMAVADMAKTADATYRPVKATPVAEDVANASTEELTNALANAGSPDEMLTDGLNPEELESAVDIDQLDDMLYALDVPIDDDEYSATMARLGVEANKALLEHQAKEFTAIQNLQERYTPELIKLQQPDVTPGDVAFERPTLIDQYYHPVTQEDTDITRRINLARDKRSNINNVPSKRTNKKYVTVSPSLYSRTANSLKPGNEYARRAFAHHFDTQFARNGIARPTTRSEFRALFEGDGDLEKSLRAYIPADKPRAEFIDRYEVALYGKADPELAKRCGIKLVNGDGYQYITQQEYLKNLTALTDIVDNNAFAVNVDHNTVREALLASDGLKDLLAGKSATKFFRDGKFNATFGEAMSTRAFQELLSSTGTKLPDELNEQVRYILEHSKDGKVRDVVEMSDGSSRIRQVPISRALDNVYKSYLEDSNTFNANDFLDYITDNSEGLELKLSDNLLEGVRTYDGNDYNYVDQLFPEELTAEERSVYELYRQAKLTERESVEDMLHTFNERFDTAVRRDVINNKRSNSFFSTLQDTVDDVEKVWIQPSKMELPHSGYAADEPLQMSVKKRTSSDGDDSDYNIDFEASGADEGSGKTLATSGKIRPVKHGTQTSDSDYSYNTSRQVQDIINYILNDTKEPIDETDFMDLYTKNPKNPPYLFRNLDDHPDLYKRLHAKYDKYDRKLYEARLRLYSLDDVLDEVGDLYDIKFRDVPPAIKPTVDNIVKTFQDKFTEPLNAIKRANRSMLYASSYKDYPELAKLMDIDVNSKKTIMNSALNNDPEGRYYRTLVQNVVKNDFENIATNGPTNREVVRKIYDAFNTKKTLQSILSHGDFEAYNTSKALENITDQLNTPGAGPAYLWGTDIASRKAKVDELRKQLKNNQYGYLTFKTKPDGELDLKATLKANAGKRLNYIDQDLLSDPKELSLRVLNTRYRMPKITSEVLKPIEFHKVTTKDSEKVVSDIVRTIETEPTEQIVSKAFDEVSDITPSKVAIQDVQREFGLTDEQAEMLDAVQRAPAKPEPVTPEPAQFTPNPEPNPEAGVFKEWSVYEDVVQSSRVGHYDIAPSLRSESALNAVKEAAIVEAEVDQKVVDTVRQARALKRGDRIAKEDFTREFFGAGILHTPFEKGDPALTTYKAALQHNADEINNILKVKDGVIVDEIALPNGITDVRIRLNTGRKDILDRIVRRQKDLKRGKYGDLDILSPRGYTPEELKVINSSEGERVSNAFDNVARVAGDQAKILGFSYDNVGDAYTKNVMLKDPVTAAYISRTLNKDVDEDLLNELTSEIANLDTFSKDLRGTFGALNTPRRIRGRYWLFDSGEMRIFDPSIESIAKSSLSEGMFANSQYQTFTDIVNNDYFAIRNYFKTPEDLKKVFYAKLPDGRESGNLINLELVAPKYNSAGKLTGFKKFDKTTDAGLKAALANKDTLLLTSNAIANTDKVLRHEARFSNKTWAFVNKHFTIPFKFGVLLNPGFLLGNVADATLKQATTMSEKYGTDVLTEYKGVMDCLGQVKNLKNDYSNAFDHWLEICVDNDIKLKLLEDNAEYVARDSKSQLLLDTYLRGELASKDGTSIPMRLSQTERNAIYNYWNLRKISDNVSGKLDYEDLYNAAEQKTFYVKNKGIDRITQGSGNYNPKDIKTHGLFLNNRASDFVLGKSEAFEEDIRTANILNDLRHNGYTLGDLGGYRKDVNVDFDSLKPEDVAAAKERVRRRTQLTVDVENARNTMFNSNFDYDRMNDATDAIGKVVPFPVFFLKNFDYWMNLFFKNPQYVDNAISLQEGLWGGRDTSKDDFTAEAKGRGAIPVQGLGDFFKGYYKPSPLQSMFSAFHLLNNPKEDLAYRVNPLARAAANGIGLTTSKPEDTKYRPYNTNPYQRNIKKGDPEFSYVKYGLHNMNPYERAISTFSRTPAKLRNGTAQLSDFLPSVMQPDFGKK